MTLDPRMGVIDPALRVLSELNLVLRDHTTLTPLARAVLLGTPVAELKKYKQYVDSVDEAGRTPLRLAVEIGSLEMVKELVDNLGCNVDLSDADGLTPLHVACARGDGEVVDILLHKAKNSFSPDRIRGETPLVAACRNMNWELVDRLIKMDVSQADSEGRTPLHWIMLRAASITDCMDAVNCLLANQANVNAQDKLGRAPLHFAAERGLSDACLLLIKRGAKINVTDAKGETPLHKSVLRPNVLQGKTCVLQTLLDSKADPTIRSHEGKTVEDVLLTALQARTWNDSQKIAMEVAIRRMKKATETLQKA